MKYCIINADDFGASHGINRGIIEAHRCGVVTSTSLMVNLPDSEEAASMSHTVPYLSVGLHVNFTKRGDNPVVDLDNQEECHFELHRQFRRFQELTAQLPTHLDSHHNTHFRPRLLPEFLELAKMYKLPLRGYSAVRYFSDFYGQCDGETHLEQISVESLIHMLTNEFGEGFTELGCHPGYIDPDLKSAYLAERETELQTLCNPAIRKKISELQIRLISFDDLKHLLTDHKP